MPWSSQQRQLAARAWKQTGQDSDLRKLFLRQFPHARFDENGVPSDEPSSKSPKLTQTDMEDYMSRVELMAGGQLKGFSRGYWQERWEKEGGRLAWKIQEIVGRLEGAGQLARNGAGLRGWIERNFEGRDQLNQLSGPELVKCYEGLKAFAKRNGVRTQT